MNVLFLVNLREEFVGRTARMNFGSIGLLHAQRTSLRSMTRSASTFLVPGVGYLVCVCMCIGWYWVDFWWVKGGRKYRLIDRRVDELFDEWMDGW